VAGCGDKGQYVREQVVAAFLLLGWPRLHLALACDNADLLRKVLKRTKKHNAGKLFISELKREVKRNALVVGDWRDRIIDGVLSGRSGEEDEWL
jgi:hypothetical protein